MNRKTNIFYSEGNDSNFLTFDNYTEALTGDILATDQKLWPSRFLCLYVKALDGETPELRNINKREFINKYLVPYYENKLAFLRDNCSNDELNNILPLNYLLDLIYYFAGKMGGKEYNFVKDVEIDLLNNTYYDSNLTEEDICLNYISDIVEQDYNGSYADIICTITTSSKYKPYLSFYNDIDLGNYYNFKIYNNSDSKLYGWETEDNQSMQQYINHQLIFDAINLDEDNGESNSYNINSLINTINVTEYNSPNLKFNVIIPLFDSEYINKISNNTELVLDKNTNVPLGIYFTGKTVELEQDDNGVFNANWSLLISMQFKPFPYSFGITHNFDDSDAIKDAYVTFAEILAKQNDTIKNLTKYNNQILSLQNKIGLLESSIKSMSTTNNVDDINVNIMKINNKIDSSLAEINRKINELTIMVDANKLRWKVKNNE